MNIQCIVCGAYQNNCWLLLPDHSNLCILVDPGDDLPTIRNALHACGRSLSAILLTHAHFDHTLAAQPLWEEFGVPVYLHTDDEDMLCEPSRNAYPPYAGWVSLPCPSGLSTQPYPQNGCTFAGVCIKALHTPGHSKGSVCLYLEEEGLLFTGDTIFAEGFGRTDLYGGSMPQLRNSILFLLSLPGAVRLFPGHGDKCTIAQLKGRYC